MKVDNIDIAMTCYNCAPFIPEAIQSILNQSYSNWTIYFVDDASEDNSLDVAVAYKNLLGDDWYREEGLSPSQIILIKRQVNGGYGPALKTAIEAGNGDLIAIVDADDAIVSDALERMVQEHRKNPKAAVVYSRSFWCDANMHPYKYGPSGPIPKGHTLLDCLDGGPKTGRVSHLKVLKRRFYEMTAGVGDLRKRIDKDLMLKMEEVGDLVFIPDVLYYYRDHPRNLTNLYFKMDKEDRRMISEQSRKILINAKKRRGLL